MRFAKLEMKIVLAILLIRYDFELVDGNGNFPKEPPVQDRNDIHQVRSPSQFIQVNWYIFWLCRWVYSENLATWSLRTWLNRKDNFWPQFTNDSARSLLFCISIVVQKNQMRRLQRCSNKQILNLFEKSASLHKKFSKIAKRRLWWTFTSPTLTITNGFLKNGVGWGATHVIEHVQTSRLPRQSKVSHDINPFPARATPWAPWRPRLDETLILRAANRS